MHRASVDMDDLSVVLGIIAGGAPSSVSTAADAASRPAEGVSSGAGLGRGVGSELVHRPRASPLGCDGDMRDIMELQLMVAQPARRKFQNRTWEHCAHVRSAKALKRAEADVLVAQRQLASAKQCLAMVAHQYPMVQRHLDLRPNRALEPSDLVVLTMELASCPCKSTDKLSITAAARAAFKLSIALVDIQRCYVDRMLQHRGDRIATKVVVVSYQWDETIQSMRNPRQRGLPGAARSHSGQVRVQSMVGQGHVCEFTWTRNSDATHMVRDV